VLSRDAQSFGSDKEIEKQVSNRTKITHENEEWAFCHNANNKAVGLELRYYS